ncbi:MAG: 50S ribosomal protein L29 [Endomicrobium sp.]|nr:50S ribosomal protein L29 [Endomicrobium sp.]
MSEIELNVRLDYLQDRIFKLRFRNSISILKNPLEIREIRRNIARIKTILTIKGKSSPNKIMGRENVKAKKTQVSCRYSFKGQK